MQTFHADSTVGLVPMSAKPMHQGHYSLIEFAAAENDHVIVFVSSSDRSRRGEQTISGADMLKIWTKHLEHIMPSNVIVEYGTSPVRKIYELLGAENEKFKSGDHNIATYTIYAGTEDIDVNFPDSSMEKYILDLWHAGLVDKRKFSSESVRRGAGGYSGTTMRKFIQDGNLEGFMNMLPSPLSDDERYEIWKILTKQQL